RIQRLSEIDSVDFCHKKRMQPFHPKIHGGTVSRWSLVAADDHASLSTHKSCRHDRRHNNWGESTMKRIVFLVLAGMAAMALAATPADAAKRKKGKRAPAAPVVTDVNDASFRLVRDSFPMWLPT